MKKAIPEDEGDGLLERFGYGLASALVGIGIWTAIVYWISVTGKWQVFAMIAGLSFLGGLLFGKSFFELTKDLLQKIW